MSNILDYNKGEVSNQSLELVREITRLQDRIFTDSQKFSTKLDDQKIVEILNNPIYNEKTLAILNKEVERCSQEKRDRFIQMSKEINDIWMNLIKDDNKIRFETMFMQTKAYLVNLREINKDDLPISFRPTSTPSTNISSISLPTSTPLFKSVKQWVGQTLTNIKGRITSTTVSQAAAETPLRPGPKTPTQGPASNKHRAPPPPLTPTTNGLAATQARTPAVTPTTQGPGSTKSRAPPPPLTPGAQFEPVTKNVNSSAPASTEEKNGPPPLETATIQSTPTTPMSPPMPPFFEQGRNSTGSSPFASTNTVTTRPMGNYLDEIIKGRSQLKSTNVNTNVNAGPSVVTNPSLDTINHIIDSMNARRINIAESSEENSENEHSE